MKRVSWFVAAVFAVVVAAPVWAGGEKCASSTQVCLNDMSKKKAMGWLGMEYDKSNPEAISVKAVTPGSPAEAAGFMAGDVLVALNGAKFSDKEGMKKAKGTWAPGQSVTYTVKRAGAEKEIAATLAKMPQEVFTSMVGSHLLDNHVVVATAAAETATGKAADKK